MARYERGETVILECDVYTLAGNLTNPTAGEPTITITDPDGNILTISDIGPPIVHGPEPMTQIATGKYSYDHNPVADAPLGWYAVRYSAVDSGRTSIEDDGFELGA